MHFDLPPTSGETLEKPEKQPSIGETLGISTLSEVELLNLRAEIDQFLPTKALVDLNMERELVIQLIVVQNLQRETLRDDSVPANQKAQTSNAVASTLATLSKLQTEMYTSERLKKIEQVLIETLQTLPQDAQELFLAAYEDNLGAAKL